jgi:spore germination protein GerM
MEKLKMRESNPIRKGRFRLLVGFFLLAAILGGLFFRKYLDRQPPPRQTPAQILPEQEGVRAVSLFFASPDGSGLVRESRLIDPCSGLDECIEEVLGELINGPIGDLSPSLPETTMYHGVSLNGDLLTIDFGRELPDGIISGSAAEMAAVYSVVNSMAVNFTQVKSVRFLVDGKPMDTLKGHIDLREPLSPDYTLEKKEELPTVDPTSQRRKQ